MVDCVVFGDEACLKGLEVDLASYPIAISFNPRFEVRLAFVSHFVARFFDKIVAIEWVCGGFDNRNHLRVARLSFICFAFFQFRPLLPQRGLGEMKVRMLAVQMLF